MALRLADRLSAARKARQLSQAAVGTALNPPRSRKLVWEWEKGRCEPSIATVAQLAKLLGVEPCWLAWGIDHGKWPRTIKGYELRNYLEYQPSKAERDNANKAAADNRHSDLMQHFRGFLSGPNRCPGCAGHGITDRGTTCKACLGDGRLTSAVRGRP